MARRTPPLQSRTKFHAYWGIYDNAPNLPNATGNPLTGNAYTALEPGDTAYLLTGGPAGLPATFVCTSAGTAGGGDAVWVPVAMAAGFVPNTRQVIAGAGLTGGGDLSADRTFDVVANADASIVVTADDIRVGVLATDAQHGLRGGGTQHAVATALVAGFMSATDKAQLTTLVSRGAFAGTATSVAALGAAETVIISGSITLPAGTAGRVLFGGNATIALGGPVVGTNGAELRLYVDGVLTDVAPMLSTTVLAGTYTQTQLRLTVARMLTGLAAGAHTVALRAVKLGTVSTAALAGRQNLYATES